MSVAERTAAQLGARIIAGRKASGLTQEEFASLVGVDRQYLSEIERGKVTHHLERLAAALDAVGLELVAVPRSVRLSEDRPTDAGQRPPNG